VCLFQRGTAVEAFIAKSASQRLMKDMNTVWIVGYGV
jgi:hypothetical protein